MRFKILAINIYPFGINEVKGYEVKEIQSHLFFGNVRAPRVVALNSSTGELQQFTQREWVRLGGGRWPAIERGMPLGEVIVGSKSDREVWQIQWHLVYGVVVRAPGGMEKGRFVNSRQFYDDFGVCITEFIHQGVARLFAYVTGLPQPALRGAELAEEKHDMRRDCRRCRGYRRLITSDMVEGDGVEGCQVGSLSTSRSKAEGPNQVNWICAVTGECPSKDLIDTANSIEIRGENGSKLVGPLQYTEPAESCSYYLYRGSKQERHYPQRPSPLYGRVDQLVTGGRTRYSLKTIGASIEFSFGDSATPVGRVPSLR